MSITFPCPSCRTLINVADQFAGKKARCKACNNKLIVPGREGSCLDTNEPLDVIEVVESTGLPAARRGGRLLDSPGPIGDRDSKPDYTTANTLRIVFTVIVMIVILFCLLPLKILSLIARKPR